MTLSRGRILAALLVAAAVAPPLPPRSSPSSNGPCRTA